MDTPKDSDAKASDVEAANLGRNDPERGRNKAKSAADAAMTPATGAPVQHAFAGAALAAEGRAGGASETDEAIKRAAGNDRRV